MNKEEFVKKLKNKNNLLILVILIIGIVFMAASNGDTDKKDASPKDTDTQISEEERLEEILSKIDGVGEVSVMVTYYSGTEKSIAYEVKKSTVTREDKSEQSEDAKAVTADGEPMVVKEVYPEVKGVIVTAQGAGSASVKSALSEAVMAALGVPAHRICIFEMTK